MKCCPYLFVCLVDYFRQVISWALQHLQWELWEFTKAIWTLSQLRVHFQDGISSLQLTTHFFEWFVLLHKNGTVITRDRMNFENVSESLMFIHMWIPKFMHFNPAIICDFGADTVYNFCTNTKLQFEHQPLFTIALLFPRYNFKPA